MEIMRSFHNTKVQLLCTHTEETFFGWIVPSSLPNLLVNTESEVNVPISSSFTALVSALIGSASFKTIYRGTIDGRTAFDLPGVLRLDHSSQHTFQKLTHGQGKFNASKASFKLISVGQREFTIESEQSFAVGIETELTLETSQGPISVLAKVNIATELEEKSVHSTLLKISSMSRIDEGRWSKLLAS